MSSHRNASQTKQKPNVHKRRNASAYTCKSRRCSCLHVSPLENTLDLVAPRPRSWSCKLPLPHQADALRHWHPGRLTWTFLSENSGKEPSEPASGITTHSPSSAFSWEGAHAHCSEAVQPSPSVWQAPSALSAREPCSCDAQLEASFKPGLGAISACRPVYLALLRYWNLKYCKGASNLGPLDKQLDSSRCSAS